MIVKTNFFNKIQNSVGFDHFKYCNEDIRGAYVQQLMHSHKKYIAVGLLD